MPTNKQHSCTNDCIDGKNVKILSQKYNIYYCSLGNVVHFCENPPNCECVEINDDEDIVCIFSGIVQTSINDVWENASSIKKNNNPNSNQNISLVWSGKKDDSHTCTKGQCEKSVEVIDRKLNFYVCTIGNIIHRCDGIQSCPLTEVTKDGTVVCLFSGRDIGGKIEYNTFGKSVTGTTHSDPNECEESDFGMESDDDGEEKKIEECSGKLKKFTTKLGKIKKEPKRKKTSNDYKKIKNRKCFDTENPNLIKESDKIIYDLIFNNQLRDKLNLKATKTYKEIAKKAVIKYYKACNKQGIMPMLLRAESLYENCMMKCKSLTLVSLERSIQRKYGFIIIKLWELIMKTSFFREHQSKFHFKQHVLGCLHLIKDGYKYQRQNGDYVIVFHKDEFLEKHLPYQNSLKELKTDDKGMPEYTKKQITKGRNNIKGGLKSLVLQLNGEKLLIDFIKEIKNHM